MKDNNSDRAPFYGMLALIFATAVGGFVAVETTQAVLHVPAVIDAGKAPDAPKSSLSQMIDRLYR